MAQFWIQLLCLIFCTYVHSHQTRINVGLLVDLHAPGPGHGELSLTTAAAYEEHCTGPLSVSAAQHVLAARWAINIINNQSAHQGLQLELEVFDTCGSRDIAMRDIFFAIKDAIDPREKHPFIGLIGLGEPEVVSETVTTLHAFNIPLILASPRLAQELTQKGNILTTAPDMSSVVRPILAVSKQLAVSSISLISSCSQSITKFSHVAMEQGIFMGRVLEITHNSKAVGELVKRFFEESSSGETIALILEPEEIYNISQYLRRLKQKNFVLITGSIGLNKNMVKLWSNIFEGGYLVEPHMPELPDFRNYLLEELQNAKHSNDSLLREYVETVYNCKWKDSSNSTPCITLKLNQLGNKLQIDPEVTFVVKAASAFSAALFLVQVEHCKNMSECYYEPSDHLQQEVLAMLSHLSFTSKHRAPFELQGTSLHVTHNGQLIANKYAIYYIGQGGEILGVGWYSDDQGLMVDYSTESTTTKSRKFEKHSRGFEADIDLKDSDFSKLSAREFQKDPILTIEDASVKGINRAVNTHFIGDESSGVNARKVTPESYITRTWATIMVAIAAVGVVITLFMLIYVLMKICDGTLSGNQSLGVILLIGIIIIYGSVVLFVLPGSPVRCSLRVFLHPIAMSLCYGILIIKVMQLRSLVLLGLGGRISYINQYIILFFIVLVEVVIIIQWVMSNRPHFRTDSQGLPYCYMPQSDFLLLHLYLAILVVIAFLYGLTVLKIRRNYKEGRWVTLAALLSMPVLAFWGLVMCLVPDHYVEPTVCVALLVLATILIVAIFIPKMNTIAKQNSHFKHKKMQVADSVTTIFTTFTDINSSNNGSRKKILRNPHHIQQFHTKMSDAYSDSVTKNPIYEVTNGAYP